MWNTKLGKPVPFDDPDTTNLALEGMYDANGILAYPAFDLVKKGMEQYTPEWQESLTTVPAATLRRIAQEFIDAAQIGSTIALDGVTLPYRPSAIFVGRGTDSHRDGHLAYWMSMVINQLVGAINVPGRGRVYPGPAKLKPDQDGVVTIPISPKGKHAPAKLPPDRVDGWDYTPWGFSPGLRTVDSILEPEKYHLNYKPEMLVQRGCNFFTKAAADTDRISEALRSFQFIASFSYHPDEHTAFSDIVMPDTTYLEQNYMFYGVEVQRPGSIKRSTTIVSISPSWHLSINPVHPMR